MRPKLGRTFWEKQQHGAEKELATIEFVLVGEDPSEAAPLTIDNNNLFNKRGTLVGQWLLDSRYISMGDTVGITTVDFSGIRTRINWEVGEHADHLTTPPRSFGLSLEGRVMPNLVEMVLPPPTPLVA